MRSRRNLYASLIAIFVIAAVWIGLGLVVNNSYYQLMFTLVPIWAVLGLSWNLLSGYTGLVSFGHAAFFGLGAYTVTIALVQYDITPWLGIPLGMIVGTLAGVVIGYPTFRLRGHYFALSMLAYPMALLYVFVWLGYQEVSLPMKREAPAYFMQFADYRVYIALAVGLLVVSLLISLAIERSRFGLSLVAIKQNEPAAEAAGIDTLAWKMRAIMLSGALAAAAGGLYAVVQLLVTPDSVFGMLTSAQALIVALFGGVGTLWGPLIGSAILIPLSETLQANLGDKIPGIQGVVYGIAIILVVVLAPEGIFWRVRDWVRRPRAVGLGQVDPIAPPLAAAAPEPVPPQRQPILIVANLSKSFGGLRAVADASFAVGDGEILGIIGPNGAGKTTLFNLLNGFLPPNSGSVTFAGRELIGLKPNRICRLGIGRTFQVVRAFARLSVLDNVVIGAYGKTVSEAEAVAAATAALAQVGLTGRAGALAGSLTNKELRLMELARALAGQPRLLLMDEPLAGLASHEIEDMLEVIRALATQGTTVVIIEHTMRAMVRLAERFIVLDHGAILASGQPGEIVKDESVIEAYLGKKWAAIRARG
ncbi:MAG: branched-chain amino acid ABC transporter ATP-binding protein/permease [Hyphomicrobiales bacterium]|nr:branched-chain amino acid ABC transporter ATP-binding protein/permease [Hyphomicrobiales bacterium]MBV9429833.1 branched-chain amino acid ABC transporter ATP-binding protein/permease [Bradyrhizobiaceae bacterium]